MNGSTRRGRHALAAAVLAVLVAMVVVVLVRDDGGDAAPTGGRAADRLESLDVEAADFEARWDAAIEVLGGGDALGELTWSLDESLGLEQAELPFASWGLLEVYRQPDGDVAAVDLVGRYVSDDDRSRFRVDTVAAVAAVLDEEAPAATALVDDDLGFNDAAPEPTTTLERDGITIVVERSATSAELRISRT